MIQNGIYRLLDSYQETARYYFFFTFQYTIESDETGLGVWTACLNASAGSLVAQPLSLLSVVQDDLEEDPAFAIPRGRTRAVVSDGATDDAAGEILRSAVGIENNANRRLARDAERINAYYRDLLRQNEKRISRRAGDAQAEKERRRASTIELDRAAKLEDLARKYSLRIRIEPGDVLVVPLP